MGGGGDGGDIQFRREEGHTPVSNIVPVLSLIVRHLCCLVNEQGLGWIDRGWIDVMAWWESVECRASRWSWGYAHGDAVVC